MRGPRLLVVVVVATAVFPLIHARPALACSCASSPGPTEIAFEGTVTRHREPTDVVRFEVTKVIRGDLPRRIDAHISHNHVLPGGMRQSDTCAIADTVEVGKPYRVEVYKSEFGYFANLCGGSIVPIDDAQAAAAQPSTAAKLDDRRTSAAAGTRGLVFPAAWASAAFVALLGMAARARGARKAGARPRPAK